MADCAHGASGGDVKLRFLAGLSVGLCVAMFTGWFQYTRGLSHGTSYVKVVIYRPCLPEYNPDLTVPEDVHDLSFYALLHEER